MTVWQDIDVDALSLTEVHGSLDLPPLSDEFAVRCYCRTEAEGRKAGLVEVSVVEGAHGPAVMFVYKRLDMPAFVFTGMLLIPAAIKSLVWTIVARERGVTGVREAIVTGLLAKEGKLTVESYESSWAQDPYDPNYCGVDRSTLRYFSDDDYFDPLFPRHPLSKVRRELSRLVDVRVDSTHFDRAIKEIAPS